MISAVLSAQVLGHDLPDKDQACWECVLNVFPTSGLKGDGAVEEMAIGVEKYQWLVLGLRLGSNGMDEESVNWNCYVPMQHLK